VVILELYILRVAAVHIVAVYHVPVNCATLFYRNEAIEDVNLLMQPLKVNIGN